MVEQIDPMHTQSLIWRRSTSDQRPVNTTLATLAYQQFNATLQSQNKPASTETIDAFKQAMNLALGTELNLNKPAETVNKLDDVTEVYMFDWEEVFYTFDGLYKFGCVCS